MNCKYNSNTLSLRFSILNHHNMFAHLSSIRQNSGGILLRINRNMFRNIIFKLACSHSLRKHLIQLLQTPPLRLWNKEEHKHNNNKVCESPNISVLPTPIQSSWIDEI